MNLDLLFFRLAALKSLAVAKAMPTFFALRVEKIASSIFHISWLGGLYIFIFISYVSSGSFSLPESPHALYLAVVQIDHKSTTEEAQVLAKVFTDDLESVLRAAYPDKCQLTAPKAFCQTNKLLVEAYFQTHFSCQINNTSADLAFLSASLENEAYWLKFTLNVPIEWNTVSINAPFFTEIFSTQSNIIHLLHGDEKRFARLTKGAAEVIFEF